MKRRGKLRRLDLILRIRELCSHLQCTALIIYLEPSVVDLVFEHKGNVYVRTDDAKVMKRHMGAQRSERADEGAVRGSAHDSGLEEMDGDENMSSGSQGNDLLDSESTGSTNENGISDTGHEKGGGGAGAHGVSQGSKVRRTLRRRLCRRARECRRLRRRTVLQRGRRASDAVGIALQRMGCRGLGMDNDCCRGLEAAEEVAEVAACEVRPPPPLF